MSDPTGSCLVRDGSKLLRSCGAPLNFEALSAKNWWSPSNILPPLNCARSSAVSHNGWRCREPNSPRFPRGPAPATGSPITGPPCAASVRSIREGADQSSPTRETAAHPPSSGPATRLCNEDTKNATNDRCEARGTTHWRSERIPDRPILVHITGRGCDMLRPSL